MNPFIFAELGIKCALLKRAQLESETRSQLLNADFLSITKYVSVMTKEHEITLIMKGNYVTACVLRIVRKQGCKRTTYLQA